MARVWLASPGEAAEVARLLAAFRDHWGDDWPPDDAFRAGVDRLIGRDDTEFLLGAAGDGEAPAGVAALRFRFSLWTDSDDCWLEDLYVEPAARGTGLGRALVDASIERARVRGCRRIELDVADANDGARALYASAGFADKLGGTRFLKRAIAENLPPGRR